MIDDAGPAVIARQLVGTLDLLLPCVPYIWDEEGTDDHGTLGQCPIDRSEPECGEQLLRLGVGDQQQERGGYAMGDPGSDGGNIGRQTHNEHEGEKLE